MFFRAIDSRSGSDLLIYYDLDWSPIMNFIADASQGRTEGNTWLSIRNHVEGSRVRLFCLPHAGSGTAIFHSWKRSLPSIVDVCPILLPGREARLSDPLYTDSQALIQKIAEAIELHLDKPYALFGHSMGALLAFEVARQLHDKGLRPPSYLFVSGRIAANLPLEHGRTHDLPTPDFLAELDRRYGGLPRQLLQNQELLDIYLPILRADMQVLETHPYGDRLPLDCPIIAFAGSNDQSVPDESLHAWSTLTRSTFSVHRIPGDHFYLATTGKARLLEILTETLTTIDAKGPATPPT